MHTKKTTALAAILALTPLNASNIFHHASFGLQMALLRQHGIAWCRFQTVHDITPCLAGTSIHNISETGNEVLGTPGNGPFHCIHLRQITNQVAVVYSAVTMRKMIVKVAIPFSRWEFTVQPADSLSKIRFEQLFLPGAQRQDS